MSEKKEQTFESAVKDLEKIVSELESGELDLDKSIEKYTEAMKLIQTCEKKLHAATKTVNKLVEANGKIIPCTVDGIDLKEYVFAINKGDEIATGIIDETRAEIYKKTGAYLETVYISDLKDGQYAFFIEALDPRSDRTSEMGYAAYVDGDKNIHFESEFHEQFEKAVLEFNGGTLRIAKDDWTATTLDMESRVEEGNYIPQSNAYFNELRYFADCVKEGRKPDVVKAHELEAVLDVIGQINAAK